MGKKAPPLEWLPAVKDGSKKSFNSQCGNYQITLLPSRGEQTYYVYRNPRTGAKYLGSRKDLGLAQQMARQDRDEQPQESTNGRRDRQRSGRTGTPAS